MPFIAPKSLLRVSYTPARATASKLLPAAWSTAERFRKMRSVSATIPLDHLAGGRVLADLTAEEKETTDFERQAERADRRRRSGRGNGGLDHGRLR